MDAEHYEFSGVRRATGRSAWIAAGVVVISAILADPSAVSAAPPVRYVLDLREPATHSVAVTMTVPQPAAGLEIQFPAWNALYQIRDFVRNVGAVTAQCDGRTEKLTRVDLETWRRSSEPCNTLEAHYSVYVNEESVFSSILSPEHGFLNLAMLLFYLPQERDRAAQVRFLLPEGWVVVTPLQEGKTSNKYSEPNYDALVDCPVEAAPAPPSANEGSFHQFSYEQNGATYRVAVFGDPADYSSDHLLASLQKITATETALMHDVPFSRYTFIFHLLRSGGSGGMEHRDGTAIGVSSVGLRHDMGRLESVAAHEFFHAWNVKRIRPQGLEPVDYVHGNDTRDLWFSEGLTSTYGDLALVRAGLISRQEFYRRVGDQIRQLQQRPARFAQSVEQAGGEAWLEKYSDYFRPERSISYYNKGELLGFLLDLAIRHATENRRSLDDVMRRMNEDFAKRGHFFTDADLRRVIAELAPGFTGLDAFFRDYVLGTTELDYQTYLGFAGLRVEAGTTEKTTPGFRPGRRADGTIEVQSVEPGGRAEKAGLKPGDVIVQLNGRPLSESPRQELAQMQPGQKVEFKVRRDSRTLKIKFKLGSRTEPEYRIEELPSATPEQLAVRAGWLEGKQ
jgi:predicted metalloprotease with PDZ domain